MPKIAVLDFNLEGEAFSIEFRNRQDLKPLMKFLQDSEYTFFTYDERGRIVPAEVEVKA
jgi:hypothetical protein